MNNPFKPISISLSPNTERDDISLALKLIFQFWKWKKGKAIEKLEKQFREYLGVKYAFSFNSGRSALMAILQSLDLESKSEVLLQAFTCNAAVNPILWSGLKPIYIDCDENNFNIDIKDLRRKITKNSKVLMIQHTFGRPVEMDEIIEICQENNLILIEDCAHSLGAEYLPLGQKFGAEGKPQVQKKIDVGVKKKTGTLGKAGFFSFGRDKVISTVYGGIAVTNDEIVAKKLREFQKKIGRPSNFWTFQQLLHPVLMNYLLLPFYSFFSLGKFF